MGDKSNPANYRGITLVNVTAKIFSLILRNRINAWCEQNGVFYEGQFGFRDCHSTTDAIFLLHAIIQKVLCKKSKLYSCFIDYQRAFDTVNRDALWIKLIQSGISCKMVNMIKCIYNDVQSCLKLLNANGTKYSEFFDVTIGLKQGEPLSPLLFILFINDIYTNMNFNDLTNRDLELLSMYMILFADDIVLFTTDPESLQSQIDAVHRYSNKWGLKINVQKTKICIFEKKKSTRNITFFIDNEIVEIVDDFTYLGVNFSYTGNLSNAVKILHDQALKAYSSLISLFSKVSLDLKTKLALFDSMVTPILMYGSEVWGVYNYKDVDKLHIKFLKYLLGVKKQTPNSAVYGELGRFPLSVLCKERSIKFWIKIMSSQASPIFNIYMDQCATINGACWAKRINSIIDHLGFNEIRVNFDPEANYVSKFKQRIRDHFVQEWNAEINNMPKLELYCKYKIVFERESYIDKINNEALRKTFSQFRLSSHKLEIETGRYSGIARENRICKCCSSNMIESEYHFLLTCPLYRQLRLKYLERASWPSLNLFQTYMSASSTKTLLKISKFIKEAFELRNYTLENISD